MDKDSFLFIQGSKFLDFSINSDCLSMSFNDGVFSAYNQVTLSGFDLSTPLEKSLQMLKGCTVMDAYSDKDSFTIDFGGVFILISLKEEDYTSPEAASWHGKNGQIVVIN